MAALLALAVCAWSLAPASSSISRRSNPIAAALDSSGAVLPAVSRTCTLASLNPLVFDSSEVPDTLDPAVSFSIPGWGAVQQVYQSLIQVNGSSATGFAPLLADAWSFSPDGRSVTFHLRSGIRFSNGDPLNAYGMWFSLNRALVMNQAPAFILEQNFWYPGVTYYGSASASSNASAWMASLLNTFDFAAPTMAQLSVMEASNQSFQVVDTQTIALHVGAGYLGPLPYTYLLSTLASPIASAVDPAVVQANGGVSPDASNNWMTLNMLGTGPFTLSTFNLGTGYTLSPDPNYWGATAAAAQPWNAALQPARSSIQIRFVSSPSVQLTDLETGVAAGIPSDGLDAARVGQLQSDPCVVTKVLDPVYGSVVGGWWLYMDQTAPPFNNLSVRRAIAHAVDVAQILGVAFGGYAQPWVGPVAPGVPYANPTALLPYAFDLALAQQAMNESPWPLPTGYPVPINFEFVNVAPWPTVAVLLQNDLTKIGLHLNPVGLTLDQLYQEQSTDASGNCVSTTSLNGGPFYIGLEFWTADYLAPDDWTQNNAISYGSANMCMAHYVNATVDALVLDAASQSNPLTLDQDYARMTQLMYDNVTDVWLAVPDVFEAYHPSLRGIVPNPMGSAAESALTLNTMYAVPPITATASVSPSPVAANATATLRVSVSGGTPPYTVTWQFGDGTTGSATAGNTSHIYTAAANYTANVTVRDGYGGYATSSVLVSVNASTTPPPPPPPSQPALGPEVYVGIAGVAVVAAALAVLVLLRRRRRQPPVPPAEPPLS